VPVTGRASADEERVFAALLNAIAEPTANGRVRKLNGLAARNHWLPLPGYGGISVSQWQQKAGKSALAQKTP